MLIQVKGYPAIQLDTITEFSVTATANVVEITAIADVAGSLGGKYFHLYSDDNTTIYTIWFDVNNGSTAPSVPYTTLAEVDISANDTPTTIAAAMQSVINSLSDFTAIVTSADATVIEVTNGTNGSARTAHDPNNTTLDTPSNGTGFTFTETTKGITDPTIPSSFIFYRITGRIHDAQAYQRGAEFKEFPFKTRSIEIITDIRNILSITED